MNKITTLLFILTIGTCVLSAQSILVQPYLQDAEPNSIRILWETDEGTESVVEWGLTVDLGNVSMGTSLTNEGVSQVHDVKLEDLSRFTAYYYRVKTGDVQSEIFNFKTPPFASDHESFRLIAMSDMQRDGNNPDKFREIVENGVIDFLEEEVGGELIDNVAMVLIPGDLVVTGQNYSQWANHFFTPSQSLLSHVPVYPVLGNHENNSIYYFNYFHLPENGSEGFEEHWWYKDYGNTRIIGLNSNGPFNTEGQLLWLEEVLSNSCADETIDFVFAQLHHPHKSELWLPGESNFTGEVIQRLEQFSTDCSKPSVHFFGHTHGYSRGQSRDHKHHWINVATAGGAIDNWGEFPQFDYDEFSVSHDDWGFVSVEVTDGDNPSFTVKRISRGNDLFFRDNELRDSFTVRMQAEKIEVPIPIFPIEETVNPNCVILKAGDFSGTSPHIVHGQSHWQISTNCDDFSEVASESWKNFENYYFDENTQLDDDLTDERIINLEENTSYCWRVRYRDRELNWSEWSIPVSFETDVSSSLPNLLVNTGAEDDLNSWMAIQGVFEALTDGECDGISPYAGEKYFAVGGVCEDGAYGEAAQDVDVSAYADSIAMGDFQANFGGYLSDFNGNDLPEMWLAFLDENDQEIGLSPVLSTLNNVWTMFEEWVNIPIGTVKIRFTLSGTRNSGSDNDCYFDQLFLRLGHEMDSCDEYVTSVGQVNREYTSLQLVPNPIDDEAIILIPPTVGTELNLMVKNMLGQKVNLPFIVEANGIKIKKAGLSSGTYFFYVSDHKEIVGNGKFVVR